MVYHTDSSDESRKRMRMDGYLLEFQGQGEFLDMFGQKLPGILEVCMNECCDDCVRVRD
jgi:hypothetical protein